MSDDDSYQDEKETETPEFFLSASLKKKCKQNYFSIFIVMQKTDSCSKN